MSGRFKQPIWIVPLVIAALVAAFGWWGNIRLRETVQGQLEAKLNSILDANVASLEIWATNQTRVVTLLAEEAEVRTAALRILERSADPTTEGRRPGELLQDHEAFGDHLRPKLNGLGYIMAQLVDTNYVVVANSTRGRFRSNQPVPETHTNKFLELFTSDEPVLITPFKPQPPRLSGAGRRFPPRAGRTNESSRGFPGGGGRGPSRPEIQRRPGDITLMQVAAPIRDRGVVRGALAVVINPTNEFTRILSVAASGDSGETYAFDQTGLLISRSRFDDQLKKLSRLDTTNSSSALNLRLQDPGGDLTKGFKPSDTNVAAWPLIHIVSEATEGVEEGVDVKPYRDYRGVPVVGAWRWLPHLGFGVATQIDAEEAYRPLRVVKLVFVALFLLLVLSSMIMFLFSYANLNWQRRLNEAEGKLKQLGQYTLEEKIGEGGMGVVYRARHALMRRDTAVKLLLPDRADAAAIQRFEREVRLTCQLTHPNTIQVYDYGHTPEGVFYYAMEYLRGLNLHQFVARFGPQPEGRAAWLLAQVCDSLAEAHASGLVHRDIKPGNVFLCERGGVPDSIKVLDFGLVRQYSGPERDDPHLTGERHYVGTPGFMAPEVIKDSSRSNPASDLYSVGALGYFLITGQYVYTGESVMEIYEQQLTTTPVALSQRTTHLISPHFEKALMSCLSKDPAARPQSAIELRNLLLASPLLAEWTPDARTAWWTENRTQIYAMAEGGATAGSPVPTVKIDFGSRMK